MAKNLLRFAGYFAEKLNLESMPETSNRLFISRTHNFTACKVLQPAELYKMAKTVQDNQKGSQNAKQMAKEVHTEMS